MSAKIAIAEYRARFDALTQSLWANVPDDALFHYTSFSNYLSILESKSLWASEIRYMNDAREVNYFAQLLIRPRLVSRTKADGHSEVRAEFKSWLETRILKDSDRLFVISLSAAGNLLSQWRSYTKHGQGLSIGFHPKALQRVAQRHSFSLVQVVYNHSVATKLAEQLYDLVIQYALDRGAIGALREYGQAYFHAFSDFEPEILRLCAIFKDPAFAEEKEWRLLSVNYSDASHEAIRYRSSGMFISPYVRFGLDDYSESGSEGGPIICAYIGPTSVPDLVADSVRNTITRAKLGYRDNIRVEATRIPLRPS